jgi:hypothetical protein
MPAALVSEHMECSAPPAEKVLHETSGQLIHRM